MPRSLSKPTVRTRWGAARWTRTAGREIGLGFHPDTAAADYISVGTGRRLFGESEIRGFELNRERAFELLGDAMYTCGSGIQSRVLLELVR